ncbi:putative TrmH family tRNA/rRNA methyltransferase [Pseudovibrio sp. W64]|uniref:RNA methyltransferase n=1 Tax=unclassified Pseudovibrio TaxID=2627060 RepID=UPI0007AEE09B|nr:MULTISPECIES: RNA methyltransferase [unclassified Pseudovibrio]KZK77470.1 putative TrmH family tRNA/rRNA methyltransferase [Pseudovibrio sp. W64]KZL00916.1 putative TrmH family tRNA/rRNA methyltransferase [Pseudovibrio sp. Ad5]
MRGYFAIGSEGLSKSMNVGTLMRTGHAFGASYFFTVDAHIKSLGKAMKADTSKSPDHLPYFAWNSVDEMQFPRGCKMVGVELTDDAIELPSFGHPLQAAYILGPERGSLSKEMQDRCDYIVKIPTKFCLNVGVAAALVLYDRYMAHGKYAERSLTAGAPKDPLLEHIHGAPIFRTGRKVPGFDSNS